MALAPPFSHFISPASKASRNSRSLPIRFSASDLRTGQQDLPHSDAFACLRLLALVRLSAGRKIRNKRSKQSVVWQPFSLGALDQTGRQEAGGGQQNSRLTDDAGATTADADRFSANGFEYGDHAEEDYRSETVGNGRRRTNSLESAVLNGDSQSRRKKIRSTESSSSRRGATRTGRGLDTVFYGDTMEEKWDTEAYAFTEELFDGPTSMMRLDVESAVEPRAVWQPAELELVELGRESDLRFMFLELLMGRAREGDIVGVEEAMSDMAAAGLKPGPRSYHGLVVVYSRSGDTEGALQALRREVNLGQPPLQETFTALVRSFAAKGQSQRGEEILAAMDNYKLDSRPAWLILVEELLKAGYLKEANDVFLRGAEGGLKAADQLYDILVEENAKVGDHANAITILRFMEYRGRDCKTFHYNCLLMIEANAREADIALERFESMRYGSDDKKPDTETYNWLIQAQTRCETGGERCQQVVDLLGLMVEDYKRVQPSARTYALLVECFTKYNVAVEAVRHFRALSKIPGGMKLLYNDGKDGDPLSLYLRASCLEGRIEEMIDALEAMEKDNQPITPRAMIVNRKGRTLVSSWIEPLQQEAELGYEVDYIARYIAEGGLTGTRKRWSPSSDGKSTPLNPDSEGFAYAAPMETSFRKHCIHLRRSYALKLFKKLRREGVHALGPGATESDLVMVLEKLRKDTIVESSQNMRKPKAASKMLVSELKEELAAQGLPADGTRPVLYQRVQKARRINRARGRPLWLPPVQEEPEQVDDRLAKFMSRLNLKNETNTEYWKKRFLGEAEEKEENQDDASARKDLDFDSSDGTDSGSDADDGDAEEDAEEEADDLAEDGGEEEEPEPPALLATQLMKNGNDASEKQRYGEGWIDFNLEEKLAQLKAEKRFDVSDMYTIADAWGWTWEKELDAVEPEKWSKEREVKLGMDVMKKVLALGGIPTIGDCAMLLRAALRTPWPEALVNILQQTHKLGYVFGSTLYDEVVTLCIKLDEREAAIAIVTDMEDAGITVPDEILDKILPDELPLEEDLPS